jgi:hypothetical protein
VPYRFDDYHLFKEGLAAVKTGGFIHGKWGYIDSKGKFVIPARFKEASSFSEGLASIEDWDENRCSYIDKTGEAQIQLDFCIFGTDFTEGLALVRIYGLNSSLHGFLDKRGRYGIDPVFKAGTKHYARPFQEGLAAISINGKYGFIDKSGKFVIPPAYLGTHYFAEGLCPVWPAVRTVGFINKEGRFKIPAKFNDARSFSEGLAAVKVSSHWGYIDNTGNYAIRPRFNEASSFSNGLAKIVIDDKYGFTDKKGKVFFEPKK